MSKLFYVFLIVTLCFLNHVRCASVRRKFYHHNQRRNLDKCQSITEIEMNKTVINKIKQFYCAADELKNNISELIQTEKMAIMVTSQENKQTECDGKCQNVTCKIYAVAVLLKTKLTRLVFHEVNMSKINVNIIRLFESVLTSLNSIAAIQWELYEMINIDKTCKMFISDHELEENYHILIKMNSGLDKEDILGEENVITTWIENENYTNNFCLPNIK